MAGLASVNVQSSMRRWAMRARLLLERLAPPKDAERRRIVSVDAVRAIAIGGMLMVNNAAYGAEGELQFHHVWWEGLRFADVVFPAFLFVAGVSMALSYDRRGDQPPLRIWTHLLSRVVALIAIGLVLNYYKYGVPLRYAGVLQRIALASLIAAPVVRKHPAYAVLGAGLFLYLHTAFLLRAQAPGVVPGSFDFETSIALWIDRTAFGIEHLYRQRLDPEGLLGVLSSAGQVMLGIAVGGVIARWPRNWRTPAYSLIAGFALVVAGFWLEPYVPIIKNLWTASYVLLTSGLTLMVLASFYALADLYPFDRPIKWLSPLGRNALAVYVGSIAMALWLQSIVVDPNALPAPLTAYATLSIAFMATFGEYWGAVSFSAMFVVVWYAIAAALDQSRIYIKL